MNGCKTASIFILCITETKEMESLTVRGQKSKVRCQQGQPPSEGSREESLLASSSFWGLQVPPGLELHHSLSSPTPTISTCLLCLIFCLFLAVRHLHCCMGPPLVVESGGYSLASVHRLLIAVASFEAEHRL